MALTGRFTMIPTTYCRDPRFSRVARRLDLNPRELAFGYLSLLGHAAEEQPDGELEDRDAVSVAFRLGAHEWGGSTDYTTPQGADSLLGALVDVGLLNVEACGEEPLFSIADWHLYCRLRPPYEAACRARHREVNGLLGRNRDAPVDKLPTRVRKTVRQMDALDRDHPAGPPADQMRALQAQVESQVATVLRRVERRAKTGAEGTEPSVAGAAVGVCPSVPECARGVPKCARGVPEGVPADIPKGTVIPIQANQNSTFEPNSEWVGRPSLSPSPSFPRSSGQGPQQTSTPPSSAGHPFSLLKKEKKQKSDAKRDVLPTKPNPSPVDATARAREAHPEPRPLSARDSDDFVLQSARADVDWLQEVAHGPARAAAPAGRPRGGGSQPGRSERGVGGLTRVGDCLQGFGFPVGGRGPQEPRGGPRSPRGGGDIPGAARAPGAAAAALVEAVRPEPRHSPAPRALQGAEVVASSEWTHRQRPGLVWVGPNAQALARWCDMNPQSSLPSHLGEVERDPPLEPTDVAAPDFRPTSVEVGKNPTWRIVNQMLDRYAARLGAQHGLTKTIRVAIYKAVRHFDPQVVWEGLMLNLKQEQEHMANDKTSIRYFASNIASHCQRVKNRLDQLAVVERIKKDEATPNERARSGRIGKLVNDWIQGGFVGPNPVPITELGGDEGVA